MSNSLSSLLKNLSDGLYNDKCTCLEYISAKDNQLIFKCLKHNKNHNKNLNKDLIKRFASTYKLCNKDIYKFILLLRKGVYSYEYMSTRKRFDEVSFPNKKKFYSSLNMEEITDADYMHAKSIQYL